jgi:hypothetical protein
MDSMREFRLEDITLDYSIYRRGNVNSTLVAELTALYTERPETFEPLRLWVDDGVIKLCDGFARYLAAQAAGLPAVVGFIDETLQTAWDATRASVRYNRPREGLPKAKLDAYILDAYHKGLTVREIQSDVSKSQAYIVEVLKPERERDEWIRDLDILRFYLAGHTDEAITEELRGDHTRQRITQIRANLLLQKEICRILTETRPDYVTMRDDRLGPHLLDPWGPPSVNFSFDVLSELAMVEHELEDGRTYWACRSNVTPQYGTERYPGRIPGQIVECLLHLYTKPFDCVYDPFAGGGTTLDVCKAYFRRSWGSDIAPLATRRDIRQHDILRGAPPFFPQGYRMQFILLDPPSWAHQQGEYAADSTNLAHLPLQQFYEAFDRVLTTCTGLLAPDGVLALLIGPTHTGRYADHTMDMVTRLDRLGLSLINRLVVPYATAQTRSAPRSQRREGTRSAEPRATQRMCMRFREVLVMQAQERA